MSLTRLIFAALLLLAASCGVPSPAPIIASGPHCTWTDLSPKDGTITYLGCVALSGEIFGHVGKVTWESTWTARTFDYSVCGSGKFMTKEAAIACVDGGVR